MPIQCFLFCVKLKLWGLGQTWSFCLTQNPFVWNTIASSADHTRSLRSMSIRRRQSFATRRVDGSEAVEASDGLLLRFMEALEERGAAAALLRVTKTKTSRVRSSWSETAMVFTPGAV